MTQPQTDVTILVNSCDLYEDAWYPFFKLLKIQWPQCEKYNIVFNTESIPFHCDFLNIRNYCGEKSIPWSERLKNCLDTIDSKYIIFFLEDFFLKGPVNTKVLNACLKLLDENQNVGCVSLVPELSINDPYWKTKGQYDYYFTEIVSSKARINAMTAIWKKDFLYKLLKNREDPWEFERNATIRAKLSRKKVYCPVFHLDSPVFDYKFLVKSGYGISSRKWLPRNKQLFEKYDIHVNFERLGWYPEISKTANIKKRKKTKKEKISFILKHPIQSLKKVIDSLFNKLKVIVIYIKAFV